MASIIIVEDEAIVAMEYKLSLIKQGHSILGIASCADSALMAFLKNAPDLLLIDIKLKKEIDGVDLAAEIRKRSNVPILFLTGNSDPIAVKRMKEISNSNFLGKPILTKNLYSEIDRLLNGN